jgi:uncharacterized protein (TIGR03000 family)
MGGGYGWGGWGGGRYIGFSGIGGFNGYQYGYNPYWYGTTSGYATYPGYYGFAPGSNYVYGNSYPIYNAVYDSNLMPGTGVTTAPIAPAAPYTSAYPTTGDAGTFDQSRALVTVRVPDPSAQVFIEGTPTTQGGTTREFVSPPLQSGQEYTYTLRARFNSGGQEVDRTRKIDVRAGSRATVDFTNETGTGTTTGPTGAPGTGTERILPPGGGTGTRPAPGTGTNPTPPPGSGPGNRPGTGPGGTDTGRPTGPG